MTAQVHDTVLFEREAYLICGVRGRGLFDPRKSGWTSEGTNTACARGYSSCYIIKDRLLQLAVVATADGMMHMPGDSNDAAIAERKSEEAPFQAWTHEASQDPLFEALIRRITNRSSRSRLVVPSRINFTGNLLLGSDFIEELYVHSGFKAPYTFQKVIELSFDGSVVTSVIDRSLEMQSIRQRRGSDGTGGWKDPELWVEGSYSLDY